MKLLEGPNQDCIRLSNTLQFAMIVLLECGHGRLDKIMINPSQLQDYSRLILYVETTGASVVDQGVSWVNFAAFFQTKVQSKQNSRLRKKVVKDLLGLWDGQSSWFLCVPCCLGI